MDPDNMDWVWILIVIIFILILIAFFTCACKRKWVRRKYQRLLPTRETVPSYTVECYGRGKVHKDILTDLPICGGESRMSCLLFVYAISREVEDLRNALQWVESNRGIQREDICAVILLKKVSNKHAHPIDVDHQGVFDDKTVVVRILWKEQLISSSGFKVQEGPRYWEALKKVTNSIMKPQPMPRGEQAEIGQSSHGSIAHW